MLCSYDMKILLELCGWMLLKLINQAETVYKTGKQTAYIVKLLETELMKNNDSLA